MLGNAQENTTSTAKAFSQNHEVHITSNHFLQTLRNINI